MEKNTNNLFNNLVNMLFNTPITTDAEFETIDITTKEGYEKYNELVDTLEDMVNDNPLFKSVITEETIQSFRDVANSVYNCEKETECNCEETECNCTELSFIPSSKIDNVDVKMQIHRLTQEYVDTMLKPYIDADNKTINNAYTALYEFACWIFTHK